MKIIGTGTGTSEARTTHKIQVMEKKSFLVKENVTCKTNLGTKQSENLGHYAKTKSKNNKNNGIKNKSISKEQKRHHKPNEPNRCLENALPKHKRLIFFSAPHGTFSKSDHSETKQSSTVIRMLK